MKISGNKSFDCYTAFDNSSSANQACKELRGHVLNGSILGTKLYNSNNLIDEAFDFVPKIMDNSETRSTKRSLPIPTWHVATYREGRGSFIRSSESIQRKVGNIPHGNMKDMGKHCN